MRGTGRCDPRKKRSSHNSRKVLPKQLLNHITAPPGLDMEQAHSFNHCRPQPGTTIILSPARLIHIHHTSPSYRLGHIIDHTLKSTGGGFFQTRKSS